MRPSAASLYPVICLLRRVCCPPLLRMTGLDAHPVCPDLSWQLTQLQSPTPLEEIAKWEETINSVTVAGGLISSISVMSCLVSIHCHLTLCFALHAPCTFSVTSCHWPMHHIQRKRRPFCVHGWASHRPCRLSTKILYTILYNHPATLFPPLSSNCHAKYSGVADRWKATESHPGTTLTTTDESQPP